MNPILKNILAVLAGLILGSFLNMALVIAGANLVPVPSGADISTPEGLKASMHLFRPVNFLFPFLAHALGTLLGAVMATILANAGKKKSMAMLVGILFMLGGTINVLALPSPLWFNIADLSLAYLPMALLGYRVGAGLFVKTEAGKTV